MEPTLSDGDKLLVLRARKLSERLLNKVVVVKDPRDNGIVMIKRVTELDQDSFTVMGDNPSESTDSRTLGRFPAHLMLGVAIYRYFPLSRSGRLN
jgi:nickel-type superoxide dismutase maturation protease